MFFRTQHFKGALLGNKQLNKLGLHLFRIRLSNICQTIRSFGFSKNSYHEELQRNGVLVIPNFLESVEFIELQKEIKDIFEYTKEKAPSYNEKNKGFGGKIAFDGGFDRYDGSTLNRYIDINEKTTPASYQFIQNKILRKIYTSAIGSFHTPSKFSIYKTVYLKQQKNLDKQNDLHRDTFQPALKLWYFTEDVTKDDGPFEYILGSHRLTESRMKWEKEKSIKASRPTKNSSGAFRLNEENRLSLGYPDPTPFIVKENTLIIADVRGFHRRGDGKRYHERSAIYANFRPHPFSIIR